MQDLVPLDEIKNRAAAIRLKMSGLAALAGVSQSLLSRAGRHDIRMSSAQKLSAALIGEERRLFEHLAGRHPEWLRESTAVPAE